MTLPRFMRLLPSVVLVGGALLAAKTTGLVHAAYAEAGQQVAALADTPAPTHEDYAATSDDDAASAGAADVLGSLTRRRKELDARQQQLQMQANVIAAAEARVDAKITQLKQLQGQIAKLLDQRDEAQKAQVAALVKTYSTMKPRDAARIFDALPDDVQVPVAQAMKSDVLALILANMTSDSAKALTVKLANRLVLPATADATLPQGPAAQAPAPAPLATAAKPAAKPKT